MEHRVQVKLYCIRFALSWAIIERKSGIGMLPNNSYTAYIQRSKQFTQQFERLVFVLVEEEQGVLSFK